MPIQITEVTKILMSVHRMNQAGLNVALDGKTSYFNDKKGNINNINYEGGKYQFDAWTEKPQKQKVAKAVSFEKENKFVPLQAAEGDENYWSDVHWQDDWF